MIERAIRVATVSVSGAMSLYSSQHTKDVMIYRRASREGVSCSALELVHSASKTWRRALKSEFVLQAALIAHGDSVAILATTISLRSQILPSRTSD